jgi:ParB-like chromosome segregation protein Spo0J
MDELTKKQLVDDVAALKKQMKIVPIGDLEITKNPKGHSESDIEEVRRSFRMYGWTAPIIVQAETMKVLAGHKRYYAAIKDGLKKVPVIEKTLTDLRSEAYKIADNELSERGHMDRGVMAAILGMLDEDEQQESFDLTFLKPNRIKFIMEDPDSRKPNVVEIPVEVVPLNALQDHPRNYREHPDDQIEHIVQSLKDHGFYRNVVVAKDGTVLAGHGVVAAARQLGLSDIPVIRLNLEPLDPQALKILTGDNEIGHLGIRDDRMLTEVLRELKDMSEVGLEGTGFDDSMLANLVYVTRPQTEIKDVDEASHWVGMPEYDEGFRDHSTLTLRFRTVEDRDKCMKILDIDTEKKTLVWPPKEGRDDHASVRFEIEKKEESVAQESP